VRAVLIIPIPWKCNTWHQAMWLCMSFGNIVLNITLGNINIIECIVNRRFPSRLRFDFVVHVLSIRISIDRNSNRIEYFDNRLIAIQTIDRSFLAYWRDVSRESARLEANIPNTEIVSNGLSWIITLMWATQATPCQAVNTDSCKGVVIVIVSHD